jgi:ABC-type lipoprotein release transport system permease subunit
LATNARWAQPCACRFGVNSEDGLVFTSAGFTLIVIGMLANYIPARGAGRIDPITALHNE